MSNVDAVVAAGVIDLKTILEIIRVAPDVASLPKIEDFNDFYKWCRSLGRLLSVLARTTKTSVDDRVVEILTDRIDDEGVMRIIHSLVIDILNVKPAVKASADVYEQWSAKGIEPSVIFLVVELVIHIIKLLRNT